MKPLRTRFQFGNFIWYTELTEEIVKGIPKALEELTKRVFDGVKECGGKLDYSTFRIIFKRKEDMVKDPLDLGNEDEYPYTATLAVKITADMPEEWSKRQEGKW